MPENHIDPVLFGRVLARLDEQDEQIKELRKDVKDLVQLANQGKGSLLMLCTVGGIVSSILTWIATHLVKN